jgi:hypothetical protein
MATTWQGLVGTPGYTAGASGTVTVPAGASLIRVWCRSTAGGTVNIFGVATVPLIANAAPFEWDLKHTNIVANGTGAAAQIVFTGTDSYFVHWNKTGNV